MTDIRERIQAAMTEAQRRADLYAEVRLSSSQYGELGKVIAYQKVLQIIDNNSKEVPKNGLFEALLSELQSREVVQDDFLWQVCIPEDIWEQYFDDCDDITVKAVGVDPHESSSFQSSITVVDILGGLLGVEKVVSTTDGKDLESVGFKVGFHRMGELDGKYYKNNKEVEGVEEYKARMRRKYKYQEDILRYTFPEGVFSKNRDGELVGIDIALPKMIRELTEVNAMIAKEDFLAALTSMKKQYEIDTKCSKAAGVIFPDTHPGTYNNYELFSAIITLLQKPFGDKCDWVDIWCWEWEFGKRVEMAVVEVNGVDTDLSSPEALYDFLISGL